MAQCGISRRLTLVLVLLAPILALGALLALIHPPLALAQGPGGPPGHRSAGVNETPFARAIRPSLALPQGPGDSPIHRPAGVNQTPFARANTSWDNVDGQFTPGARVWFTVTTPSGATIKGTGSGTAGPDGWMDGPPGGCHCDIATGDRVHVTSDAGFDALLVPIAITGHIDAAADRVSGKMSPPGVFPGQGAVWVWSEGRQQGTGMDISIAADGSYSADFSGHFDILAGDEALVWYFDANGNQVGTKLQQLRFDVNYRDDWVAIQTEPNAAIVVTVVGKATMQVQADETGQFQGWRENNPWVPAKPDIQPGDTVSVQAAGYTSSVDPVGTITGTVNKTQVSGSVTAPGQIGELPLRCEVWVPNAPGIQTTVQPNGGQYVCDFGKIGWTLVPGQEIAVRYALPSGNSVINVFSLLYARANIVWDNVDGQFTPGATVWFTVTNPSGTTTKGTGGGTARSDGWMNGPNGGCQCDIAPGDRVHVTSSAGFDALLVPIAITGHLDAAADRVSGKMGAPGVFPAQGYVWVWSELRNQGSSQGLEIAADGTYSSDFTGQFDIQGGDHAEVWYFDASGNVVGTILQPTRFDVNYRDDWLDIQTAPNAAIVVTVVGKASMQVQADGGGWYHGYWQSNPWVPAPPDIQPGDTVTVESNGYTSSVSPVGTIDALIDPGKNTVLATVSGVTPPPQAVRCDVWTQNGPPSVYAVVQPNGSYLCDFKTVGYQLRAGPDIAVRYFQADGSAVVRPFALHGVRLPLTMH